MKKIVLASFMTFAAIAAANAAPQTLTRTPAGYNVTYQYQDQPQIKNWYVGGKLMGNYTMFTIKRSSDNPTVNADFASQSNSGLQLGAAAFVGTKGIFGLADDSWRAELELGYLGKYTNPNSSGLDESIQAPYALVSANWNTAEQKWGWFYIGAGVGAAMPMTTVTSHDPTLLFTGGDTQTNVSVLVAGMLGYRVHIADNWFLDIGYKFMAFDGGSRTNQYSVASGTFNLTEKFGWVMNHSINVGVAWEF